tara:strand:- start:610 stop:1017 length:408 start_codon:yes stop_codon:yes gene_type:complete
LKTIKLKNLLSKTIKLFFSESKFTSIGKLEWFPPTKKEIKKTLDKSGVKVSQQRYKYFKTDEFEINSKTNSSNFHQLLISEIEEDGIFYCVYDFKSIGPAGQKTRYKFQLKDFQKNTIFSNHNIELLEKKLIMIR